MIIRQKEDKSFYIIVESSADWPELRRHLIHYKTGHLTLGEDLDDLSGILNSKDLITELGTPYLLKLDFSLISMLTNLESLGLESIGSSRLDLGPLKKLKYLGIKANKKLVGLNHLTNLERMHLWSWKVDFGPIPLPPMLRHLELISSNCTSLEQVLLHHSSLETLGLFYCRKLSDLTGVERLINLQLLKLENCPGVNDLAPLVKAPWLQELDFWNGKLDSIKPLNRMNLKSLSLRGDSVVKDGEMSLMNEIEKSFFLPKKHYKF